MKRNHPHGRWLRAACAVAVVCATASVVGATRARATAGAACPNSVATPYSMQLKAFTGPGGADLTVAVAVDPASQCAVPDVLENVQLKTFDPAEHFAWIAEHRGRSRARRRGGSRPRADPTQSAHRRGSDLGIGDAERNVRSPRYDEDAPAAGSGRPGDHAEAGARGNAVHRQGGDRRAERRCRRKRRRHPVRDSGGRRARPSFLTAAARRSRSRSPSPRRSPSS